MSNDTSTEQIMEDLQNLAADAEVLLASTGEVAGSKASAAREKLMAAIETAKNTCKKLEKKAVAGAKATDQAIRTHPYESMFVALGLGIVIGLLIRRK